ncbi:MAG: RDD family protein [Deltaproteobacteria bacterium]|nr:MAG: RDD family protein [Deltaproteobacteria bacterium]
MAEEHIKADLGIRFLAALIDGTLCIVLFIVPVLGWIIGTLYILFRDGLLGGGSLGKKILGLKVLHLEKNQNANFLDSILRNLPLAAAYILILIPVIGWIIAPIIVIAESLFILSDEMGNRFGDRLANTQVVE